MITKSWLYDALVYIYALSLLFYFSDFVGANRKAKRMGTGLLSFVWVLQFIYLVGTLYGTRSIINFNLQETLLLYSWLLITLTLVIQRFFRIELFVFLVNVLGFAGLALPFFINPSFSTTFDNAIPEDRLLLTHVVLAVASYATFAISAVFSGMYLFLHRQLKEKNWSQTMKRLPSLEVIDRLTSMAVIVGAPALLAAIALGVIWIWLQGDADLLFDSKVYNSLIVLGAYTFYVIQRFALKMPGVKLALWNMGAFAFVLINLIVSNYYSAFHQWIGK